MSKLLTLKPRISEKTYGLSQLRNLYVFQVPLHANKFEVADAVAAQYDVTVISVNCMVQKGKPKRTVRKGGRPTAGKRSDMKKAYVTLQEGDSIPVFAAINDAPATPDKKEKK